MFTYQAELLVANAILNASGTYKAPTFGELNKPTFNGDYYSIRSFTSAGYYSSTQNWFGNNGVIMRGDPIIGTNYGRNDFGGGEGSDVLYGSTGTHTQADGNGGNDLIITNQSLWGIGDDGNDVIVAGMDVNVSTTGNYLPTWQSKLANANNLSADALHKLFRYGTTTESSTLFGNEGNDVLIAMSGDNNRLYGDEQDNTGNGNDTLIVGDGNNNILYAANGNNIIMTGDGSNEIRSGTGIDNIFTGKGVNNVISGAGNDHIEMLANKSSEVDAGSGDDVIILSGHIGYVDGGAGYDVLSYELSDIGLSISMDEVHNIEVLVGTQQQDTIIGSSKADRLEGLGGNDTIYGESGNDTILGGAGDDIIHGEAGNDSILGGTGNDDLYGGTGNDFYFESGQFGQDLVFEGRNEGTDDRIIFEDLTLSQVIYGRQGDNLVFGNAGLSNAVIIVDWFQNFGIDSIWCTTGTQNQYNVVSAQAIAEAFGVTIPTTMDGQNDISTPSVDMPSNEFLSGETLANSAAIELLGVEMSSLEVVIS